MLVYILGVILLISVINWVFGFVLFCCVVCSNELNKVTDHLNLKTKDGKVRLAIQILSPFLATILYDWHKHDKNFKEEQIHRSNTINRLKTHRSFSSPHKKRNLMNQENTANKVSIYNGSVIFDTNPTNKINLDINFSDSKRNNEHSNFTQQNSERVEISNKKESKLELENKRLDDVSRIQKQPSDICISPTKIKFNQINRLQPSSFENRPSRVHQENRESYKIQELNLDNNVTTGFQTIEQTNEPEKISVEKQNDKKTVSKIPDTNKKKSRKIVPVPNLSRFDSIKQDTRDYSNASLLDTEQSSQKESLKESNLYIINEVPSLSNSPTEKKNS